MAGHGMRCLAPLRFLLDLAQPMSHWGICAGMAPAVQPSLGDSGC